MKTQQNTIVSVAAAYSLYSLYWLYPSQKSQHLPLTDTLRGVSGRKRDVSLCPHANPPDKALQVTL